MSALLNAVLAQSVERIHGKDEVSGSIPEDGSGGRKLSPNYKIMPSKERDNMIKLECTECKMTNYYTRKNKKLLKDRLQLKKLCKHCKKHTLHKETK